MQELDDNVITDPKEQKDSRIRVEEERLQEVCKDLPSKQKAIADGLIRRAAYMRIQLEEYEKDLDIGGYVELFTQSEKQDPYERERPVARLYTTLNGSYQKIIKQLCDLMPAPAKSADDGGKGEFMSILNRVKSG